MGIGNTAAATVLRGAWLDADPTEMSGPGTGFDPVGVSRKAGVVRRALERHGRVLSSPHEAPRHLGGFEIAALAGSYITRGA